MNITGGLSVTKSKLLLVEGKDDEKLFNQMLKHLSIDSIQVVNISGKQNLTPFLKIIMRDINYKNVNSIGIVRDADDDAQRTFQSICSVLRNLNLGVPSQPVTKSTSSPVISAFIFPNNLSAGSLEDTLLEIIKERPEFSCIEDYFNCLDKAQNHPARKYLSKAKIHVYLAADISNPTRRLGESMEAGVWYLGHQALTELITFLKAL